MPATFHSDCPLIEAIERLRAATRSSIFDAGFQPTAMGIVTVERVQLNRFVLLVGNSYKPRFVGSFQQNGQRVVLSGHFAIATWPKVSVMITLGLLALMELSAVVHTLRGETVGWWAPFLAAGMFALVVVFTKLCQWFARNDVPWLSSVIAQALAAPPNPTTPYPPTERAKP